MIEILLKKQRKVDNSAKIQKKLFHIFIDYDENRNSGKKNQRWRLTDS